MVDSSEEPNNSSNSSSSNRDEGILLEASECSTTMMTSSGVDSAVALGVEVCSNKCSQWVRWAPEASHRCRCFKEDLWADLEAPHNRSVRNLTLKMVNA